MCTFKFFHGYKKNGRFNYASDYASKVNALNHRWTPNWNHVSRYNNVDAEILLADILANTLRNAINLEILDNLRNMKFEFKFFNGYV